MENIIIVDTKGNPSKLKFVKGEELLTTDVLIGRNGATLSKREGYSWYRVMPKSNLYNCLRMW